MPYSLPAPVANTHGVTLPPRYSIRPLEASLASWAKALMIEGFLLQHSIWEPLLPEPKVANALRAFTALDGHFSHAINSGLSYAIFDSEYEFRKSESATAGGGLFWDDLNPDDPQFEENGKDYIRAGMDFPMVCIALSIDALDKKPEEASRDLHKFIPLVRELGTWLSKMGQDSGETWEPTCTGELLIRSGCVTKPGYERRGLMTALNRFVILEAKARGYQAISVGVTSPAVYRNWMKAPSGCRIKIVANFDVWQIELELEDGRLVRPYVNSGVNRQGWLIWCELQP